MFGTPCVLEIANAGPYLCRQEEAVLGSSALYSQVVLFLLKHAIFFMHLSFTPHKCTSPLTAVHLVLGNKQWLGEREVGMGRDPLAR